MAKPAEALGVEESALVVEGGDSPSSDLMYSISTSSGLDVSIFLSNVNPYSGPFDDTEMELQE